METPLHAFQSALLGGPLEVNNGDDLLQRLSDATAAMAHGGASVGTADIAGLVRQCLSRMTLEHACDTQLRVPAGSGWPTISEWRDFSCCAEVAGASHLLVRAESWRPPWLDPSSAEVVEQAVLRSPRRVLRAVPIDPVLVPFTSHEQYSSAGQRAAVRAAFLMRPGSTLVVNLPTGAGKSLVFQLPTLVHRNSGSLTVVVVPTVALARDQERRFFELRDKRGNRLLPGSTAPLAYHSGLSTEEKSALIAAVKDGTQPILFASPEAILGTLRAPLFQAAEDGRLRYLVIDEAHLITQWGQQFRPEFQSMAGLRDSLRKACAVASTAVRTLLLSATFTQECYDTIRLLFGSSECQLAGELGLRTEPSFIIDHAASEKERERRVLDAVRHLPRPLILYTTLREDAETFLAKLQAAQFRRVRLVRGGDMAAEGAGELLRQWQERQIDTIVATSAFGLGVDHSEVRSIVHACLPETADRYYQEVGRSGRDGRASVAVLVTSPCDLVVAESLATERLISVDRGFERWQAMWSRRTMLPDGTHVVSLNDRPWDIDESGPRNISWNLRTLMLMVQAGLIKLLPHKPPQLQPNENETEVQFADRRKAILQRFVAEVVVDIQDSQHSNQQHWNSIVTRTRERLYAADRQSLDLVRELLSLTRPLNELFREIYSLSDPDIQPPYVAGSCPITRSRRSDTFAAPAPDAIECAVTCSSVDSSFQELIAKYCDTPKRCWVLMPSPGSDRSLLRRTHEEVLRCLTLLVHRGILEVGLSDGYFSQKDWDHLRTNSPISFIVRGASEDDSFSPPPPLPRVTVLSALPLVPAEIEKAMSLQRTTHIILFPDHAVDPRQPARLLREIVPYCSLEDFILRLSA
ncbi:MAG: ATP-dependent DNA helicase RecQ [Bryobacterales bacterium]|nr:ATP-dependent DNA helicase RecQ [Bryobacterales bacterium]